VTEEPKSGPRIVEAFQNYKPPFNAEKAVRRMLRAIPPKFLLGLHAIVLTNVSALSRKDRDRKTWGRRRVSLGEALGYYSEAWKGQPAQVTLLLDNIEKRMGRTWWRIGIARDFLLSETFFHEIGHHIHRFHKPEYEGKENVADKWSRKLSGKFIRDRYWYLFPLAVPISLLIEVGKDMAKLYRKVRH
jgi:hypothetical protein